MNEIVNIFGGGNANEMTAQDVTTAMATTRQAQEVQAAMIVAKRFPRDTRQAYARIMDACTRPTLAEWATYEYSRGGTKITGPSIRLAECMAQNWGNIDFGFMELDRKSGESTVQAYAWDLETNTRRSLTFTVKHVREAQGGSYGVKSERDIYELVANQAQRRVRACILALIPGDVVDGALKQCELTIKAQAQGVPIEQRRSDTAVAFAEFGIEPDMLAAFCQKQSIEYLDEADLKKLRRAYTSLRDGIVGADYFIGKMRDSAKPSETAQSGTVAKDTRESSKGPEIEAQPPKRAGGQPNNESLPFTLNDL